MNLKPLINIGVRASTMLSRFLLMFVIAKYLPDKDMGVYGLVTTTIVFSLYLVGLDFYTYSTRELIHTDKGIWGQLLKSQSGLAVILYAMYIPLLLVFFYNNLIPWYVFPYLICILIFEHICQESQRIIIAAQKPLSANIGLFIRNGLWPILVAPLIYFNLVPKDLISIFIAWAFGDFLAICFFFYVIHQIGISGWKKEINWKWVVNGVKVCLFFLVGTLALKLGVTLERYWLQDLTTIEIVGVYSFFVGVSSVISNFIDAGVISFKYPKLIKAYGEKNKFEYIKSRNELNYQVVLWILVLTIVSFVFIDSVLGVIGKSIYFEHKGIYYITLLTTIVSCLSLLPHYELYARRKDKVIVMSHVLSLGVFFVSAFIISCFNKLYAIPFASLITQFFILIFKFISIRFISKYEYTHFN